MSNLYLVHLLCHQHIHVVGKSMVDQCQKYDDQEQLAQKGKPHMEQQHHQEHEEP